MVAPTISLDVDIPLATPTLVIDEKVLDANIARVAGFATGVGLALRPHVKTHKSVEIARRQLAAGAVGITVATLSEALVFAVWLDAARAALLAELLTMSTVFLGIDSAESAQQFAGSGLAGSGRLAIMVEIDSGHHRSGVLPADSGALAAVARDCGLDVAGVFTFPGHSYSPEDRQTAARDEEAALGGAVASLSEQGIVARVVSGGSTPSLEFARSGILTEVRPGVSVFGDAQQWELGTCAAHDIALTVLATVVSRSPDRIILDSGSKVLGADRAAYSTGFGRLLDHPQARIRALSEHHATVTGVDLALGSRVRVVPNHVCTAVNLADLYAVVTASHGHAVAWPVDARGANT
jgi:D-serine deaminase-like pyridoxal phosphate-dependent protein